MTVASKTLVWRFPWAEIDPAVCDRAVKDALAGFPGTRLLKLGPPAPARARTYVVVSVDNVPLSWRCAAVRSVCRKAARMESQIQA